MQIAKLASGQQPSSNNHDAKCAWVMRTDSSAHALEQRIRDDITYTALAERSLIR